MPQTFMAIQINEVPADEIEACCTKDYAERGFSESERLPLQVAYHKDTSSESDEILGGLSAYTFGSYLSIALFWVSEGLRGQGVGKALLASTELEAMKRGCTASLVDTFDFQAEGFYVKQGYTPYARLSGGFDNRSTRIYFFKQLSTDRYDRIHRIHETQANGPWPPVRMRHSQTSRSDSLS